MELANRFSFKYLEEIIDNALGNGYKFMTLRDYYLKSAPKDQCFILRLDLDFKPRGLQPFLELAQKKKIPLTIFVRVAGPYNVFGYECFPLLKAAHECSHEIGLHTTPVEWATINNMDIEKTFAAELNTLRQWFPIFGIAPHRDINYAYNSLPWLRKHWESLRSRFSLEYHAYEDCLEKNPIYVNEGLSPHLGWRSHEPNSVISTGRSIHMLLHPHWWYEKHPFEIQ